MKTNGQMTKRKRVGKAIALLIACASISSLSVLACYVSSSPNCPATQNYDNKTCNIIAPAVYSSQVYTTSSGGLNLAQGPIDPNCAYLCSDGSTITPIHDIISTGVCPATSGSGSGGGK